MICSATIVVVGASNVGKSRLIQAALTDAPFEVVCCEKSQPTVAYRDYRTEVFGERVVIRDTAGRLDLRGLSAPLYRGADAVVFVYRQSLEKSFVALERWFIDNAYTFTLNNSCVFVLVGIDDGSPPAIADERIRALASREQFYTTSISANVDEGDDNDNDRHEPAMCLRMIARRIFGVRAQRHDHKF